MENKGKQASSVLTINGEIEILRRWWYGKGVGSIAPADEIVNCNRDTVTPGVVEMASRVNLSATSFLRAAAALERTSQVKMSGEQLADWWKQPDDRSSKRRTTTTSKSPGTPAIASCLKTKQREANAFMYGLVQRMLPACYRAEANGRRWQR